MAQPPVTVVSSVIPAEYAAIHQDKYVEDSFSSAVAIGERMDGHELIVGRCHPRDWVEPIVPVEEALPIGRIGQDDIDALGR